MENQNHKDNLKHANPVVGTTENDKETGSPRWTRAMLEEGYPGYTGWGSRPEKEEPALMRALRAAALMKGHDIYQTARELGVNAGYLHQLRSGVRDVTRITMDFARAVAQYLQTSTANVLVLAGMLQPEDFQEPVGDEARLREGLQALVKDPMYAGLLDEARLRDLPLEAKQLIVGLYEEVTQQSFGTRRPLPPVMEQARELAQRMSMWQPPVAPSQEYDHVD